MTTRIAHRFARECSTSPCSHCLTIVDLAAGGWYAADVDDLERPVCDGCAQVTDPAGYAQLLAWRRASRPTWRSAA